MEGVSRLTQNVVVVLTVALGAGAAVGAAGPLPRPGGGQQGQLRRAYGAGAHPCCVPVLRGAARPLGGSGSFGVLLGEEDGGAAAHLRGQGTGGHTQLYPGEEGNTQGSHLN